ncbi:MAG TPA: hypothetical protein VG206_23140 [Terriglobia bacterium]|nr:hypothetical protein [Terriglobia bacterium]
MTRLWQILCVVLFGLIIVTVTGAAHFEGVPRGAALAEALWGFARNLIILLLVSVFLAVRAAKHTENKDVILKEKQHRRSRLIRAGLITLATILALGYGVWLAQQLVMVGHRTVREQSIDALIAQSRELAAKNGDFRLRLRAIRSRKTPTMRDFYVQCVALESLLDEYEPYRQKNLAFLESASTEVGDDPELRPALELMRLINTKDSELMTAWRMEIAAAKQLIGFSPDKQKGYYEREIIPLEIRIKTLADEEADLLQRAQQRGAKLPSDLSDLLKARHETPRR